MRIEQILNVMYGLGLIDWSQEISNQSAMITLLPYCDGESDEGPKLKIRNCEMYITDGGNIGITGAMDGAESYFVLSLGDVSDQDGVLKEILAMAAYPDSLVQQISGEEGENVADAEVLEAA